MSDKIAFTLTDSGDIDEHWAITLDSGTFENIVYQYNIISFDGEDDDGNAKLKFTYEVLEDAEGKTTSNKEEFEKAISNVLSSILEESIEEKKYEHRTNDTSEFDPL